MKKVCEKHGEYESRVLSYYGAEFDSHCPVCEKEEEEREIKEDIERRRKLNESKLKKLNIEPEYYNATLDIEIKEEAQKRAIAYAEKIIETKTGKLVLLGNNGTGKTHIACAMVKELGGAIYSMYEISTRIRASYVAGAKETELEIVDKLATIPFLAIDEIGRTKGSEAEINWLSYVIDKRHVRHLPLVMISNRHPRKTCKENGCQKCLENYISEDVMSRLSEDGYLVTMTGEDYRRTKRTKEINNDTGIQHN